MKLATLAIIAATVAIPAAAFADSSQPNSSSGASAPAGQTTGAAVNKGGAQAGDSSVPGASIHEPKQNTKMKKNSTTGEGATDSSVPGASKH